jgi:hypothetical protein
MPKPTLLTLPPELRHQIYIHLLPHRPVSHPLPGVGLTSVSHALPASNLLNTHPQITDEVLDYFYSITTWKIIFSHAFNFFRVDPHLKGLERCSALGRLRKVEVVVYCDGLLTKSWGIRRARRQHGGPDGESPRGNATDANAEFVEEICRKVSRATEVLMMARELKVVAVSWIDTTTVGFTSSSWEEKAEVLASLRRLREKVTFKVGKVMTTTCTPNDSETKERIAFSNALKRVLARDGDDDSSSESTMLSFDGAACPIPSNDPASRTDLTHLRHLAFDDRQDRHLPEVKARRGSPLSQCGTCSAVMSSCAR